MDFGVIEIRLKLQGSSWQEIVEHEIPIVVNLNVTQRALSEMAEANGYVHKGIPEVELAYAIAAGIAAAEGCEVRWNYVGSPQGHYTGGE